MLAQTYEEKRELVFQAYERTNDLAVAVVLVGLSTLEVDLLMVDQDFQARVEYHDAKTKEELFADLRRLKDTAQSESVRLAALKELGRTLYPTRFREDKRSEANLGSQPTVQIIDDVPVNAEAKE